MKGLNAKGLALGPGTLLVALGLVVASPQAQGDEGINVGAFGGLSLWNDSLELGAFDVTTSDSPQNSASVGVRVGYPLLPSLVAEIELVLSPTETRASSDALTLIGTKAHLLYEFSPDSRLRPFVVGGVGMLTLATSAPGILEEDTDLSFHLGGGLAYDLSPSLLFRIDLRALMAPTTNNRYVRENLEFFAGFQKRFGEIAASQLPDGDRDGVFDIDDECPLEAEDQDGFHDSDGCPDPDNDEDGIPDAQDSCPAQAELRNGIDDEDGCPDTDGDTDGVLGSKDLCPTLKGSVADAGCPAQAVQEPAIDVNAATDDSPTTPGPAIPEPEVTAPATPQS